MPVDAAELWLGTRAELEAARPRLRAACELSPGGEHELWLELPAGEDGD